MKLKRLKRRTTVPIEDKDTGEIFYGVVNHFQGNKTLIKTKEFGVLIFGRYGALDKSGVPYHTTRHKLHLPNIPDRNLVVNLKIGEDKND